MRLLGVVVVRLFGTSVRRTSDAGSKAQTLTEDVPFLVAVQSDLHGCIEDLLPLNHCEVSVRQVRGTTRKKTVRFFGVPNLLKCVFKRTGM